MTGFVIYTIMCYKVCQQAVFSQQR